jgi:hypothetical protein
VMSEASKAELERLFGKTDSCPSLEQLIEDEQVGLSDPNTRKHVNECPFCKTELASWRAFEYSQPSAAEEDIVDQIAGELDWRVQPVIRREVHEPARTRTSLVQLLGAWFRSKQGSALSLAFVCSALLVISLQIQFRHSAPLVSRVDTPQNWRGNNLTIVGPTGSLDAVPNSFRWKSIPSASQYEVRVLGVDGAELWKTTTASTDVVVGPDLNTLLAKHSVFFWRVTGLSSEGRQLASSELERVEVRH